MSEQTFKLRVKTQKEYPEFTDEVDVLSIDSLEKKMSKYAKYREEVLVSKENDEDLQQAKEEVKVLSGPYSDTLKALKMKTAYINILIDEKTGGS